jgi:DNA repair protein RecN (Recombination protein N)
LLLELRVNNLGIIEDINWKPDAGLNVITGETGAGKSLIIDAVELLLNATAGEEVIRYGAGEACIEGLFGFSAGNSRLKDFLEEKGLLQDDDCLVINYEVRKQKPGVVRINGHLVTKTVLRQTGQLLIDIHGQSEHLSLLDKKYHLDFLDSYAHTSQLRNSFSQQAARLHEINSSLKMQEEKEKETARQEEFLRYQVEEIQRAGLQLKEDEELEKERRLISFSQKLKDYAGRTSQALSETDALPGSPSAIARINEALQAMRKLVELDPGLLKHLDYLEKTVYTLEEVARDVRHYGEKLEHDPGRLEEIEIRLELIYNLKRKYGKSIEEILAYLEKTQKELEAINQTSEKRSRLEEERNSLKQAMGNLAAELSAARSQAARRLTQDVKKELDDLEIPQMSFEVALSHKTDQDGLVCPDGQVYAFSPEGIDEVEFLVSTNPGEPLKSLAKIASTGEISRFTLALKGALSEADQIPVLIFDEIDIGIGGRSGDIIGRKLWRLAKNHQVICVTHLPQIAAYADAHFRVRKEINGDRTTSVLEDLAENARLEELAAMLAGPGFSQTALRNAGELRQQAKNRKAAGHSQEQ